MENHNKSRLDHTVLLSHPRLYVVDSLPLVDLVAAIFLQVALNVNDQWDIENDGGDHVQNRDNPQGQGEHHESHGDPGQWRINPLPERQIQVCRLFPVFQEYRSENNAVDNLSGTVGEDKSLPT